MALCYFLTNVGITRLERWERAERHGHSPPQNIKDLILEHEDDEDYIQK